jgi:hypothetical protein
LIYEFDDNYMLGLLMNTFAELPPGERMSFHDFITEIADWIRIHGQRFADVNTDGDFD